MRRNHYLITRFNLRYADWKHTKNGDAVLSESWLEERFRLFENYCLPSVKNQTNQNFKWCVFFDEETPDNYKLRISKIGEEYSNFQAIYIGGMEHLKSAFIDYIEKSFSCEDKFVISTRLDNDDIIHKDFVETIQNNFLQTPNTIIDLRKGYQVTIESKTTEIRSIDFPFNQFVSYIETTDKPIKTVMDKMHREWKNNTSVNVYTQKELWIELVHNSNKLNTVRKQFKRAYGFKNEDFGISKELEFKENLIGIWITNFIITFNTYKRRVLKKIKK